MEMNARDPGGRGARPGPAAAVIVFCGLAGLEWLAGRWGHIAFPSDSWGALWLTAFVRILDMAVLLVLIKSSVFSWPQLGLSRSRLGSGIRAGIRTSLILYGGLLGAFLVYRLYSGTFPDLFPPGTVWFRLPWPGIQFILISVLLGPFVEELVFRGLLYNGLRNAFSVFPALALSMLPFAMAHGFQPAHFLPALAGAVLFSLSFESSRSLWSAVVLHVFGNAGWWLYGYYGSRYG